VAEKEIDLKRTYKMLVGLIRPEAGYLNVAIFYGLAIATLTLAVPIAVQTLINTIANIASVRAVVILALVLFLTLVVSGVLSALRTRVMEYYERKVYARLTAELSLKTIRAPHSFFEGGRNTTITQRYFDIITLQKNLPELMIDGFAVLTQMLVGFVLVSFYHPALFVFNALIVATMYLIWKVWGSGAKLTAIQLSHAKYSTAKWLDDIASAHEFFKSSRHMDYAGRKTEGMIEQYIDTHKHHFKYTFSQTLMFLLLYALASASLLGLGGWLVVVGQLSIGQLVAAELIMSALFVGMSQFTNYLKMYYELYGAADKIGHALEIPQESVDEDQNSIPQDATLQCQNLVLQHLDQQYEVTFTLEAGAKIFVLTDQSWIQRGFLSVLKHHQTPEQGWMRLGDNEIGDYDLYELRQAVISIDRSLIVECSIKEYLRMAQPEASLGDMTKALEQVRLHSVIRLLPDGLDTRMSALGTPLQPAELLLLKLAAAILAQPKVIVLNQHFDNIPEGLQHHIMQVLEAQTCSVMYFTNHPNSQFFNGTMKWKLRSENGTGTHFMNGDNGKTQSDNKALPNGDANSEANS